MTDLFEIIKTRRSVRQFEPDSVPDNHLAIILDAARYAPTAGNNQPWRFLVVRERENLSRLLTKLESWAREKICAIEEDPDRQIERLDGAKAYLGRILDAPLIVFILVDTSVYPELVTCDGAMAAQNLMLAARALGYGTCFQTTFFPENIIHEHFDIPPNLHLICALPVGKPVEWPALPPKKPMADLVWYEHMSNYSTSEPDADIRS